MNPTEIISGLIAESRGSEAASAYRAFKASEADLAVLADVGRKLLSIFPKDIPGACAIMSALYASRLEFETHVPVFVIAGSLFVGQTRVFGDDTVINGKERFSRSDSSWDGHAWLVMGHCIADASIFRTAYSPKSPPMLAAHVLRKFGKGKGLFIWPIEQIAELGLSYVPDYVLTEDQITGLALGGMAILDRDSDKAP